MLTDRKPAMLAPESLEKTRTRLEDVVPGDEDVVLRENVDGKFHRGMRSQPVHTP
jgi:hypothetical protein